MPGAVKPAVPDMRVGSADERIQPVWAPGRGRRAGRQDPAGVVPCLPRRRVGELVRRGRWARAAGRGHGHVNRAGRVGWADGDDLGTGVGHDTRGNRPKFDRSRAIQGGAGDGDGGPARVRPTRRRNHDDRRRYIDVGTRQGRDRQVLRSGNPTTKTYKGDRHDGGHDEGRYESAQ